jgi:membrane protein
MKKLFEILKDSAGEFAADKAPRLSAALAYYALFSIAPLLLIGIAIAGFVFGEQAARGEIVSSISGLIGQQGAEGVEQMIAGASERRGEGIAAAIGGFIALLFGAAGVFSQLRDAFNTVWGIEPKKSGGIRSFLRERLWTFGLVFSVGFLLLVSLVLSSVLSALGRFFSDRIPLGEPVWHAVNLAISFAVIALLFALIFRYVPDVRIAWRDVWPGAIFTSLLFVVGKFAIGLYLGRSSVADGYGAAASLVIVLLWLYYSGMIVFFGAEFTEVWARRRGGGGPRSERRGTYGVEPWR